jgi:SPP1 family predicted phage head-tail adaptor
VAAMNVNPGKLSKKIEIYATTKTIDADGFPTEAPVLFHSCYAQFSRISGTEMIKASADFAETKVRFLIRHTKKAITRKMTVKYAGDDYQIDYLNDYGDDHKYIEIIAGRIGVD